MLLDETCVYGPSLDEVKIPLSLRLKCWLYISLLCQSPATIPRHSANQAFPLLPTGKHKHWIWEGADRTFVQSHADCIYAAFRAWEVDEKIFSFHLSCKFVPSSLFIQSHPAPPQPVSNLSILTPSCLKPRNTSRTRASLWTKPF